MKWSSFLLMFFLLTACGRRIPASAITNNFHVAGNCGMCKKTIEKSLQVEGVFKADWNKKTKMITVVYDTSVISLVEIQKKIAAAGYDNDGFVAQQSDYDNLHSCCKYDCGK